MQWDDVKERMSILHISPRASKAKGQAMKQNSAAMQRLDEEVRREGFELDKLRVDFVDRHVYNAKTMLKLLASANKKQKGTWAKLL
jgi:hypothetical protein